jgi:type VI secretion system protein ImpJ
MKHLTKVVWSEGMHLGPHHFQAQNRYFEDSIHFAVSSLWFATYGLAGSTLDSEALRNGTLALIHARGVFPDGLAFNMPECDALPPPRNITDAISPVRDAVKVLLAIPQRTPDRPNVSEADVATSNTRYVSESRPLRDETNGRDEKPVNLARKNVQLILDDEVSNGMVTLPIARVKRDGAGHFIFDPEFIPPCLNISASDCLMDMVRRLVEILEEKSATLSRHSGAGSQAFSQQELARFWFLHSVNSGLAPLRHFYLAKRGHPEELYLILARLAGSLCTFGLESDPRNVPLYAHDTLSDCFSALDQHIRSHLETIIPTSAVSIPIEATENCFYSATVADGRCFGGSSWILGIEASTGEAEVIAKTPNLIKVCSQAFIGKLVQRALPGLSLRHLPVPPPAISPRIESQYFAISKTGPCWDSIVSSRQIGIYVPQELPNPRIELSVILEK